MRTIDAERLEEELRYAKEALAVVEAQNEGYFGHKYLAAQEETIPPQFRYLAELETHVLEARVERLERDIRHLQNGEWE